jgi:DNA-binding YbaB/EbfC family protein
MADFLGMMKQAAQLQSKMQAMQEELGQVEVGGGLVSVRMTAKMEVKAVKIDPSLMKADEREILEDLLVTALSDARRKAEIAMQEKMQALTGGLGLPPASVLVREVSAGGVGLTFAFKPSREFVKRMSNPNSTRYSMFSSGPLILTFAKVPAATASEC